MPIKFDGTTGVSGVAGTVSVPAISGTDSNTGIYYPATDTVSIAAGGTDDLYIGPSGQIGIGGASYGTANQRFTSGGSSSAPSWLGKPSSYVAYSTNGSGNWTIPSTGTFVLVRAWGGGGSGGRGGSTAARAGGGGGGGYCERWYQLSDLVTAYSTQVPYTVGAGGASVSTQGSGNTGGNSTFASGATLLTAYGGGAGRGNTNPPGGGGGGGALGAGGTGGLTSGGTGGLLGGGDGPNQPGLVYPTTPWGGAGGGGNDVGTPLPGNSAYLGGGGGGSSAVGGSSVLGGAGGAGSSAAGTPGGNGSSPSGGGGAQNANGGSSGAGADGRIEIWVW